MFKFRILLGIFLLCAALQTAVAQTPFAGRYEGVFAAKGRPNMEATGLVLGEGPGLYRMGLQYTARSGSIEQVVEVDLHGHLKGERVAFSGVSESVWWRGAVVEGKLRLEATDPHYGGVFELERVLPTSPTAGLEPPPGAVVLLAFRDGEAPAMDAWNHANWRALEDGSIEVVPGTGPILSNQDFGDIRLHLEFMTPDMPLGFGQFRGNSGVYLMNRYEVQILDSFGVLARAGDCGAIYEVAAPSVNASFAPGLWQTYDIEFRAPRLGPDGTMERPARLTVDHNGVRVHTEQIVRQATPGGMVEPVVEKGPLHLQDHGDPVRYRNIWVLPLGGRDETEEEE